MQLVSGVHITYSSFELVGDKELTMLWQSSRNVDNDDAFGVKTIAILDKVDDVYCIQIID